MNEMEIGQQFSAGGENELAEVMNLYGEKLLRYATNILCNAQDAQDVVQEVFISAYEKRKSFDGKNLSAWLYKMTYNRSLNLLKKRKILFFYESKEIVAVSRESEKGISVETMQALQKLNPKERAVVYGRVMEDRSYEELSILTGSSTVALRKQYKRAKKKLANYLTECHTGKELTYE